MTWSCHPYWSPCCQVFCSFLHLDLFFLTPLVWRKSHRLCPEVLQTHCPNCSHYWEFSLLYLWFMVWEIPPYCWEVGCLAILWRRRPLHPLFLLCCSPLCPCCFLFWKSCPSDYHENGIFLITDFHTVRRLPQARQCCWLSILLGHDWQWGKENSTSGGVACDVGRSISQV